MNVFWPHDAVGWISVVGPSLGMLGFFLSEFVSKPLKQVSQDLQNLRRDFDQRLDDHERRIQHIEDTGDFY